MLNYLMKFSPFLLIPNKGILVAMYQLANSFQKIENKTSLVVMLPTHSGYQIFARRNDFLFFGKANLVFLYNKVGNSFIVLKENVYSNGVSGSVINYKGVDLKVSWVRLSDWHILTTGVVTYTKDDRISVLYKEGSLDWILKV